MRHEELGLLKRQKQPLAMIWIPRSLITGQLGRQIDGPPTEPDSQ